MGENCARSCAARNSAGTAPTQPATAPGAHHFQRPASPHQSPCTCPPPVSPQTPPDLTQVSPSSHGSSSIMPHGGRLPQGSGRRPREVHLVPRHDRSISPWHCSCVRCAAVCCDARFQLGRVAVRNMPHGSLCTAMTSGTPSWTAPWTRWGGRLLSG